MEGHLECDLGRRGPVGGVEAMSEGIVRERRETLGEFDHRAVREAGEDNVFQLVQLRTQGSVDARVGVAEEIDPPRTDAVQVAIAVEIMQPDALATGNRDHRQLAAAVDIIGMLLHLRARVPDGGQAALQQVVVVHGLSAISAMFARWCCRDRAFPRAPFRLRRSGTTVRRNRRRTRTGIAGYERSLP